MKENQTKMDRAIQFALNIQQEYDKLNSMVGMEEFKAAMQQIFGAQKRMVIAQSKGHRIRPASFHMCFLGNPGTGKTSACHEVADLLYRAGIVDSSKLMVAGRSDLVGQYFGSTAIKTRQLLDKASGGVLLIDEAYSLLDDRRGSYGDEAINTLVEEMDKRRDSLVIIFAGYNDRMTEFLANNPGLQSRIPYTVHFKDYSADQLCTIAEKFAKEDGFYFHPDVREKLTSIFNTAKQDPCFGNARYARNLVEKAESAKCDRVNIMDLAALSDDDLFRLTPEDFESLAVAREVIVEKKIGFY